MYYDEIQDYGFLEDDVQFLMVTVDGKKIEIEKHRRYFMTEYEEMDYNISYSIRIDGRTYLKFPEDVDRDAVVIFACSRFEEDKEATKELDNMYAIHEAERRFGA